MSDQKAVGRCPTCRKPTVQQHRPFCSRRCADVDTARWLGGTFVIPGAALDVADDTAVAPREQGAGDRRRPDDNDD
jgi:uncharacterized protein